MEPTDAYLSTFDDPGLKAAVRRAWGHERAPEALRAKVMPLASNTSRNGESAPAVIGTIQPSWWQRPSLRYGFAAAAMILVGFGIAYRLDDTPFGRDPVGGGVSGTEVSFVSTVPGPIAQGLRDSHDRCSKYPNHNVYPEISRDDYAAMRQRLERHLGFPVLAGNVEEALGRNRWNFKGAAVCKVGNVDAAHLVFVRDGKAISIFSLPPDSCRHAGRNSHECEDPNPDHPVAVFVWSDGVHCVVGSSTDRSLSVDQVRSVLEHLRPTLPNSSAR